MVYLVITLLLEYYQHRYLTQGIIDDINCSFLPFAVLRLLSSISKKFNTFNDYKRYKAID